MIVLAVSRLPHVTRAKQMASKKDGRAVWRLYVDRRKKHDGWNAYNDVKNACGLMFPELQVSPYSAYAEVVGEVDVCENFCM